MNILHWHDWFAWYPVPTDDGWKWLEVVETRLPFLPIDAGHQYRVKKSRLLTTEEENRQWDEQFRQWVRGNV